MNSTALVLLSGGLDSATLLAHALDVDFEVRGAVFVDYAGHDRRAHAAREVAEHYGVELTELDVRTLREALTPVVNPDVEVAAALVFAAGIARSKAARAVLTAVHADDRAILPASRPDFIDAMSIAMSIGCQAQVAAPFVTWTKAQIAAESHHLQVPVHYTWSCFEDGSVHCGRCGGCVDRAVAFQTARVPDPTRYAHVGFSRPEAANA